MSTRDPYPTTLATIADDVSYEQRCAEDAAWTGSRVFIGAVTFAYASLAFSYFYLRSANNGAEWRPGNMTAPTTIGGAIFAIVVASALLQYFGVRRLRAGALLDWEVAGWVTLAGGLLAVGLQIWELTQLPFFPGSSGYASTFIGWGALSIATLFGALYWLETQLARSLRLRHALMEEGGVTTSQLPAARVFRANAESCSYFWFYVGAVELTFWIIFYVIR
jgi:heme/copper-type cytochrome/quinol oxidase subunit 3